MKQWTKDERLILKQKYNEVPLDDLAEELGRTKKSIYNQVVYLRKRGWTFARVRDKKQD